MNRVSLDAWPYKPGASIASRYEVVSLIASNEMGVLYSVHDHDLNDDLVDMRVFYPHLTEDAVHLAQLREQIVLHRRLGHPTVAPLFDSGQTEEGYFFITMEHLEGDTLTQKIKAGPLPPAEVQRIIFEWSEAVSAAHRLGIPRCSISPDHVVLAEDGTVRVRELYFATPTDLGRSFALSVTHAALAYYMAPEEFAEGVGDIRNKLPEPRSDLYSLGLVGYEMLTGQKLFVAEDLPQLVEQHRTQPFPDLSAANADIPRWFADLLRRCAEKSPANRFISTEEAQDILLAQMDPVTRKRLRHTPFLLARVNVFKSPFLTWDSFFAIVKTILVVTFIAGGCWLLWQYFAH